MKSIEMAATPRHCFGFWMRAVDGRTPHLLLRAGSRILWRIAAAAPTCRHHAWHTYEDGVLTLEWEEGSLDKGRFHLFYQFHPNAPVWGPCAGATQQVRTSCR
jgi:hypothetical protein